MGTSKPKLNTPLGRIYVVQNLGYLKDLSVGTRSWWCVEQASVPAEVCVMYVKEKGFSLLFRFIQMNTSSEIFCMTHRMATGEIEIIGKRKNPFSSREMREHKILKELPAVRRSFQNKSFRLEEPYYSIVIALFD